MSIDVKKFKKILTRNDMLPLDYFCFKGEKKCAMVRCFLFTVSQYLLIYIPSKFRFTVSDQSSVYEIEDLEEDSVEADDYSKREDDAYAEQKLEEEKRTKFDLLQQKYQFPISLEGTEEPMARKLKRQLQRLNAPLSKSTYDLAIQQDRFLYVCFGDDNFGSYYIRGYNIPRDMTRSFLFVTSITDIIDKIEEVNGEVLTLSNKFSALLLRLTDSNMTEMEPDIENFASTVNRLRSRRDEMDKTIQEICAIITRLKKEEEVLTDRFSEETMKASNSHERQRIGDTIQKDIDALFVKKNELIKKNMTMMYLYHKLLLFMEEVSFDNSIMIDRVKKNFQLLRSISSNSNQNTSK